MSDPSLCRWCDELQEYHANLKCLWNPSRYEPATCIDCYGHFMGRIAYLHGMYDGNKWWIHRICARQRKRDLGWGEDTPVETVVAYLINMLKHV